MRRFLHPSPCSTLVAGLLLALALPVGPARADVDVHGSPFGTDHSPTVAVTPNHMYVLSFHRDDPAATNHVLRLAGSLDGGQTFQPVALPTLPENWYWRPNSAIAYDENTNQVWMTAPARFVSTDFAQIGLWVVAGFPQGDGSIDWFPPLLLWSMAGTTVYFPTVALAAGDGTGGASVLLLDMYDVRPGVVTYFHVAEDAGSFTQQDLAVNDPMLRSRTSPVLAVEPGGRVTAGWANVWLSDPWHPFPFVARTSLDAGVTFGAPEFVANHDYILDGPGAVTVTEQVPTLLYTRHSPDFPQTRALFWGSGWTNGPLTDPSDAWVATDCCDGSAWNVPGTMLDRLPGSWELNPVATMAEDGYFYLGWHDFQPYDPDSVSRFMVSKVWNMGATASAPVPLADATFDWDNVVSSNGSMGWTTGADARAGRVLFAWGDHRGFDPDVYARAFRAGGFALTEGCGDTIEVSPGQDAGLAWRIENRNELFADEYAYGASGTRIWMDGLEPAEVSIGPDGAADVLFTVAVPDTAAGGVVLAFAYAQDHVRITSCPIYLRVVSVLDAGPGAPGAVAFRAPRPNPTTGATAFSFSLAAPGTVDLSLYDLRGRRVATLVRGDLDAGEHAARWDGAVAPAGIYFARLVVRGQGGVTTRERRLVVLD